MRKLFLVFLFLINNVYSQSDRYIELDLVQCLEIALENNLQLKRSEINQEIQKLGYSQSIFQQTPSLNVFSNYGNNWGRSVDPTTNTFIANSSNFSGVGVSSNMNIFSGFSVRNSIKRSKTLLEKSVFDLDNTLYSGKTKVFEQVDKKFQPSFSKVEIKLNFFV